METHGHTRQCFVAAMDEVAREFLDLGVIRAEYDMPDGTGSTVGIATACYLESGDVECSC